MNAKSNTPPSSHAPDDFSRDLIAEKVFRTVLLHRTIRVGMIAFAAVAVAFLGYLAIMDLAGKTTQANFKWEVVASLGRALSWGLAIVIAACFWGATKLWRKRTVEMGETIQRLESQIDSERTSSGLPPTGDTDPNDRRWGI